MRTYDSSLLKPEGRVLSTLEADGSRRWLQPRLAKGRYWAARRILAYFLIALFTLLPFIKINGHPAILLDVINREFHLFGATFLPTDTLLLALFMLSVFVSVFLATALLGRVWCGWGCPQTVYLEYVFRPIERLFLGTAGRGGKPGKLVPAWRRIAMYAVYLVICVHLSNTFLAYFVGIDTVRHWTFRPPTENLGGFIVVVIVTGLMMFDMAFWREQMCIIGCPYGRMQSVLLDRHSLIVSYDAKRGEPRAAKLRSGEATSRGSSSKSISLAVVDAPAPGRTPASSTTPAAPGDCIDCTMCVQVCPTGIDIRDGLQMECIHCTQCIDACDAVMDKIKRPRGLIGCSSQAVRDGGRKTFLRLRTVIYPSILAAVVGLLVFMLANRPAFDLMVVRTAGGRVFDMTQDSEVATRLRVKIVNRTDAPRTYSIIVDRVDARIELTGEGVVLKPREMWTKDVRVIAPVGSFVAGTLEVGIRVTDDVQNTRDKRISLPGPIRG